jgi:hypothetical protein
MNRLTQRHGSRVAMVLIAVAASWAMGVRSGRVKAFATGSFYGEGRALVSLRPAYDDELVDADVAMTFTTFGSRHREGVVIETSFALPSGREVALVLDLERSANLRAWQPGTPNASVELTFEGDSTRRDLIAGASEGDLELEAAFVREGVLGFRLAGAFSVVAPDGRVVAVAVTLETTPSAEEVAGEWAPVDPCERGACWEDQGPEPGCADPHSAEVYVEPAVGCSDLIEDIADEDVDYDDYDDSWGDDEYDDSWGDDEYDDSWGDDDGDSDDDVDDNGNETDDTDDNGK